MPGTHWAVDVAWLILLVGLIILVVSLTSLVRQWWRR